MKKKLRQIYEVIRRDIRLYGMRVVFLRIPEYALSFAYFILNAGNRSKVVQFHKEKNQIHAYRYKYMQICDEKVLSTFKNKFFKNGKYIFKDIILPNVRAQSMYHVYQDSLRVYVEYDDNYDCKLVDKLDKQLPEGVYCYSNPDQSVDISVHKGDVVIDAGAWIGDFSVYAAKKGASVYAFEPLPSTFTLLKKSIEYNNCHGIEAVPYALGHKESELFIEDVDVSGGNSMSNAGKTKVRMTTLDNFVKMNNIGTIDFIKADIEGAERNMLRGAVNVLRSMSPTLSICTYHLDDDPEVLRKIILEANPEYIIIQRKMKLFAYVPSRQ